MKEKQLNKFLQGRIFTLIVSLIALVVVYIGPCDNNSALMQGIVMPASLQSIGSSLPGTSINMILIFVAALLTMLINKLYSFLGGITSLSFTTFVLFEAGAPVLSQCWNDGTMVAVVSLVCMLILYSAYEKRDGTSRVYLIFTILSLFSMTQVAYLYLMLLFFIGVIQIRIFSLRALLAIIFGIITPYWIALGLGIVDIQDLQFPSITTLFMLDNVPLYFYSALGVAIIGILSVAANFFTLMKYRLQLRVYNGFVLVAILELMLLMIIDAGNALAYFPLLNVCVAMQFAHLYVSINSTKKYICVFVIAALAITSFIATI